MTAKEGLELLEQDPAYWEMLERKEAEREARVRQNFADAVSLVADLRHAGFPVETVSDLYILRYDYRPVIALLIEWLPRIDNLDVKESIARTLTDKWARPAAALPLIAEFKKAPVDDLPRHLHYKWALGNALGIVADESVVEEIAELILDPRHLWARDMLNQALGRMKSPRSLGVLMQVLDLDSGEERDDSIVTAHAIRALGNRKAAKGRIAEFLDHPSEVVRREAAKALQKIEKAEQKDARPRQAGLTVPRQAEPRFAFGCLTATGPHIARRTARSTPRTTPRP